MKNTLVFILSFIGFISFAQMPNYEWANKIGSDSTDFGSAITTDASGNVYSAGSCMGVVDFDAGPGTYTLAPAGGINRPGEMDIYITKTDGAGNVIWAKRMGDTINFDGSFLIRNGATSISVDGAGNVYTFGYYTGTVDFDPGPGVTNLTSGSLVPEVYILKLDAAGNFLWVKNFSGSYHGYGTSLVLDASANVYVTGFFKGTLDADPGTSTQNFTSPDYGVFIIKLDAGGNYLMGKYLSGPGGANSSLVTGWSLCLDAIGNIYTTGFFYGTIDFDPGTPTNNLSVTGPGQNIFILKLDPAGNFTWVKTLKAWEARSIVADANNLYLTGSFGGTVDFDPGPLLNNVTAVGTNTFVVDQYNQYVLKLDLSGNFVWVRNLASTIGSGGSYLALDGASNVYTSGYYEGGADFDPGPGVFNLQNAGGMDGFILKLDASGNFLWASVISSSGNDEMGGLAISSTADVYSTGGFFSTCNFSPGPGTINLTSAGQKDGFLFKWSQCSNVVPMTDLTPVQNKNICQSNTTNLTVSGNASTNWYTSPTGGFAVGTGSSFTPPLLTAGTYSYYAENASCPSVGRIAVSLTVTTCAGLSSLNTSKNFMRVYPVPTKDGLVTVQTDLYENSELQVRNALGQLIISQKPASGTTLLDLSHENSGLYIVKLLKNNGTSEVQKIIKQ